MENVVLFATALASILAALAVASLAWGADSRPPIGDDHQRMS